MSERVENREVKNQWENEDCSLIKCNMQDAGVEKGKLLWK